MKRACSTCVQEKKKRNSQRPFTLLEHLVHGLNHSVKHLVLQHYKTYPKSLRVNIREQTQVLLGQRDYVKVRSNQGITSRMRALIYLSLQLIIATAESQSNVSHVLNISMTHEMSHQKSGDLIINMTQGNESELYIERALRQRSEALRQKKHKEKRRR